MNQRFLLILPLLLISFTGFAQLQKGNKILGGTLQYSTSTASSGDLGVFGEDKKTRSFVNNPTLGFFVSDCTVVGLVFNFSSFSSEVNRLSGGISEYNSDQFSFGPFVRRYFPLKEWVAFYGQADLGYSLAKGKQIFTQFNTELNYKYNSKAINLSTALGLAFFPKNWMSIDLVINPLSFSHQIAKTEHDSSTSENKWNNFNFNLNTQSFFIGAHFFFNKK
jgi:hypothetical protein